MGNLKQIGVYAIVNTLDGKVYVGGSTDIWQRFSMHRSYLRRDRHPNKHLQCAWNKYGEDAFEIRTIEECAERLLMSREQYWIDYYDSMNADRGYNFREAGTHGKLTEEHKRKIAEAHKGMKYSEGTKKMLSEMRRGKKLSEEHRRKLSEAHKGNTNNLGRKLSDETKKKIGNAVCGRVHSEETKRKISEGNKGRIVSEKARKAVAEANRLRVITDETRHKMSESHKGRHSHRICNRVAIQERVA